MMGSATRAAWPCCSSLFLPGRGRPFLSPPVSPIDAGGNSRRCCSVAFKRRDFDRLAKDTKDNLEVLLFETKKAAQHLDRQHALSQRLSSVAQSVYYRTRLVDRDLEISLRWRTFNLVFSRNCRWCSRQFMDWLDAPLVDGWSLLWLPLRLLVITLFLLFVISFWLVFGALYCGLCVFEFAAPILVVILVRILGFILAPILGPIIRRFSIGGYCPNCETEFVGYKNLIIHCDGCGNIVWQPKSDSSDGSRKTRTSSSDPQIIDVDFKVK